VAAEDGFPGLLLRAWPEHRGGSGDTAATVAAQTCDRRKRHGSRRSKLQSVPRVA
jgi:hypothetical protein